MQEFLDWTLKSIRKNGSHFSWMEERRLEWVPLAVTRLQTLLEGYTFILITDDERAWFSRYILSSVNAKTKNRPLLPFVSLDSFFPSFEMLRGDQEQDREMLLDMLSLAFPNGYIFFYIGKGNDPRAQIAKTKDDSFMWLMDEKMQNSFFLSSQDDELDVKLIQLYKLMDKTIDALLFLEVDIKDESSYK